MLGHCRFGSLWCGNMTIVKKVKIENGVPHYVLKTEYGTEVSCDFSDIDLKETIEEIGKGE